MLADQLARAFPDMTLISDPKLRSLCIEQWRYVGERNPMWTDIDRLPCHPSLPVERYGTLTAHIRAQMALGRTLVPTYEREWGIKLDLDHFLACAVVHDSAKVIEFVEKDGSLVGTAGYDHAIEGAKIALEVGFPRDLVHMISVHTYLGQKRMPRTAAAQLFQFMDPICLPVFPEQGKSAVERHLEANGWVAPPARADLL